LLISDNMESNDILNLNNSFNSNYNCRCCDMDIKNVEEKLNNYIMHTNFYFLNQIRVNSKHKNLMKINKIKDISSFFL
jgi:hypothetical protein